MSYSSKTQTLKVYVNVFYNTLNPFYSFHSDLIFHLAKILERVTQVQIVFIIRSASEQPIFLLNIAEPWGLVSLAGLMVGGGRALASESRDTFQAPTSRLWHGGAQPRSPVEGRDPEDEHEDRRHTRTHGALSRASPGKYKSQILILRTPNGDIGMKCEIDRENASF